ncbi:hypothetical protein GCM10022207_50720 [Streptomyces lannensis]|uniref:AB hydrolase-1 domain-containing protein n=1 Tax=Streptomyces lannensis TaxID=766498 RepID=A0ABP7KHS6_9ACTN
MQQIDTNHTRLSVAVGGSGPVLILLHGWPQSSRAWARVMPDLAQNHTVVVPDLRGTGDSDRPEDGYAKTNQADDIRGILTALNLTGPLAAAGHDIGSMVAFAWAAAHPEDVSHLILIDSLLPGLGLEEAMNVAKGGMWHFGFFMSPHVPEMLFDGHELEFFTATFTAMSNPGTFSDHDPRAITISSSAPMPAFRENRWIMMTTTRTTRPACKPLVAQSRNMVIRELPRSLSCPASTRLCTAITPHHPRRTVPGSRARRLPTARSAPSA